MAGAVGVAARKSGGEGVFMGDVAAERWVQAVGFLVWEAMWDEDGEFVCGVWVRAKERSKIDVMDRRPSLLRAEFGMSAVTQLDCWCSGCTWVVFICPFWCHLYSFTNWEACM